MKKSTSKLPNPMLPLTDYRRLERGKRLLASTGYLDDVRDAWQFYHDRHWEGKIIDPMFGKDGPPFINFIKPTVQYKIASIGQNTVRIVYSPAIDTVEGFAATAQEVSDRLTSYCDIVWEQMKMESLRWECIRDAAVCGDGVVYFSADKDGNPRAQVIDFCTVLLSDESNDDLQEQDWMILVHRPTVRACRATARENGLSESDIDAIRPDYDNDLLANTDDATLNCEDLTDPEDGHVTVGIKFSRGEDGLITMTQFVRDIVIQPEVSTGLKRFPFAKFSWERVKNSARANGIVVPQIPNQVEYNKILARRSVKVAETAYPMLAYSTDFVDNPDDLDEVGAKIAVTGNGNVNDYIGYLHPAQMSPDVVAVSRDLMDGTRSTAGASDAALGQINPETASGRSIMAVQDASARVLSLQARQHAQFIEDIGLILFDFWKAYVGKEGKNIVYHDPFSKNNLRMRIPKSVMEALSVCIKVDVSPSSPYSLIAQEETLENFMRMGKISFEEMVSALPQNAVAPRAVLEKILRQRQMNSMGTGMPVASGMPMASGMPNGMPSMHGALAPGGSMQAK